MDKLQSQTIDLLRFPLVVIIVISHTSPTLPLTAIANMSVPVLSGTWLYNAIEILFGAVISQMVVPLFFFFSGFLFFQKFNSWDWAFYVRKIKKRIKSLFVPYILWISLAYLSLAVLPILIAKPLSFHSLWHAFLDNDYSFAKSFWNLYEWKGDLTNIWGEKSISSAPLIPPLWFVRDLMVATLFSPLLYYYLRKTTLWGILILCLCYLLDFWPIIQGFSITVFFFFTCGIYFAINNINIAEFSKRIRLGSFFVTLISAITVMYFHGKATACGIPLVLLYKILILSSSWFAMYISSRLIANYNITPNRFLTQTCFFVYAFQQFPFFSDSVECCILRFFEWKVSEVLLGTAHTDLICYILPPILTICLSLIIIAALEILCKRFASLLIGSRY